VTDTDTRRVIFGPGRVRVSGSAVRGITPTPPRGGHGIGQGAGGGRGHGRGGGNGLAALAAALAGISATSAVVVPSPDVGGLAIIGNGAPSGALGSTGWLYVNALNRDVYVKQAVAAAPSFLGVAWTAVSDVTSQALTMPASIAAGDLLVVVLSATDFAVTTAPTVTTPAGWTRFVNKQPVDSTGTGSAYAFWAVAVGGDTVTIVLDRGSYLHASCSRYAAVNPAAPMNIVSAGTTTNSGPTIPTAALVTTSPNCTVVSYGMASANPTIPWSAPSGITAEAGNNFVTRLSGHQFGDLVGVAAGTYGPYAWTPSTFGSAPAFGVTFAIAPSATAGSWSRVGALSA
jgi:hypothetical protein